MHVVFTRSVLQLCRPVRHVCIIMLGMYCFNGLPISSLHKKPLSVKTRITLARSPSM